jgi:hypothetical protein
VLVVLRVGVGVAAVCVVCVCRVAVSYESCVVCGCGVPQLRPGVCGLKDRINQSCDVVSYVMCAYVCVPRGRPIRQPAEGVGDMCLPTRLGVGAKRALRKIFGISMPFCLKIPCRLLALAAMGRHGPSTERASRANRPSGAPRFARTAPC